MSIRDEIQTAIDRGRLCHLPPEYPVEGPQRWVYVIPELWTFLRSPWDEDHENRELHEIARATLDAFSQGYDIAVADKPRFKEAHTVLARVDPIQDECWDFRCLAPNDGMRIVGRFSEKDRFIALAWDYRSNIEDEAAWVDLVRTAATKWRDLFSSPPLKRRDISDYVSPPFTITNKRGAGKKR